MANQTFKITGGNKIEVYFSSNLKSLEHFFSFKYDKNVKNITSVDLSQLVSLEIESLYSTFSGCSSLKSIDLSYLNTTLVDDMRNMFSECTSLESIDLSHLNTSKVVSMRSMFYKCESLEYLDLSYLDFSSCTDTASMLLGCISLKVLDMSSVDLKKIKENTAMFMHVGLRYINLYNAKNFKTDEYINKMNNLTVCQNKNILNNANYQYKCCYFNITSNECEISNFIKIYYEEKSEYTNGFGLIGKTGINEDEINKNRKNRDSYFIIYKNYKRELKSDDAFAISKGSHLEIYFLTEVRNMSNYFNANIDDNLKNIKTVEFIQFDFRLENMKSMFSGCSSLKSIDISNINTSLVTDMSQLFAGCSLLESIDLSTFDTSSVLDMSKLFCECNKLTSIDLSNFKTNNVENMNSMFYHCSSLEILSLSNFVLNSIKNLNQIFDGCTSLKYLDISFFNLKNFNSIEYMFRDNKNLEYLNLYDVYDPNGVIAKNGISDWNSLLPKRNFYDFI